jgi:tetratricopeptide (TPR) repeat protein
MAFAPAQTGETLLIIAAFDKNYANKGFNAPDRIYSLITEKLPPSSSTVRVEKYPGVIGEQAEAKRVLGAYGATMLIWGWYDDGGAQANVELDKGKVKSAKTDFDLATPESFHFNNVAAQTSYLAFFSLGMMQLNANAAAATEYFTSAIDSARIVGDAANPWEALMWRGNIYAWSNKQDLAITDYTEAIKLHPHKEGYYNRGAAYGAQGKPDLAIADYTKAIEIDPQ